MKISAFSILHLKITHDYFASGTWKGLSFEVDEESRKAMEMHQLQVKARPKGFCIVRSKRDFGGSPQPTMTRSPFKIRVSMNVADPYYYNYTALPFMELRRQTLYFSNHPSRSAVAQGWASAASAVAAADCLPTFSRQFQLETGLHDAKVTVRDADNTLIVETRSQSNGEVAIDLTDCDLGCFTLQVAEEAPTQFVTIAQWGTRPAAIFDLYFDPQGAAFQGSQETELKLQFGAREIFWRYNVQLGKKHYAADAVQVKDPDQHVHFGAAELVAIDDERQLRMISTDKVRLQERYPFSLELVQSSNNMVLASRLPFPDYRNFKRHPAQQEEFLAETFLSL
jgi:hypothetical protein